MRPEVPYPSYFIPKGMKPPKHCTWIQRGVGPTFVTAQHPGDIPGLHYGGGVYDPESRDRWKKSKEGWWVLLEDWHLPFHFAKIRISMDGAPVSGAVEGHSWLVPKLLKWDPKAILVSAIPSILTDYQWQPPKHLIPILDRLRAVMLYGIVEGIPIVDDEQAVQLAVDILALNYDISYHELAVSGWLSTDMVMEIIRVAGGLQEMEALTGAKE